MNILGISCFYHDAAATLLVDGRIAAAAQEERFTRLKHDSSFPEQAIRYCLSSQGLSMRDIDYVVFYDKPLRKFGRILRTALSTWPRSRALFVDAMREWLPRKLWTKRIIRKRLNFAGEILFTEHHVAHAASAYYASPFQDATVVTIDGVGEWDTATIGYGSGNRLELTHAIRFPDSLGLLYSALTAYLGFKVNSAEYKVMGLAPYGDPAPYRAAFRELLSTAEDGGFTLNERYFSYAYAARMTNESFNELLGGAPRRPDEPLTKRHHDIAAALQEATEEAVLKIVRHAKTLHPSENLCLAGGVALNCVANGKILAAELFKNLYIQPAAGDAGGAVGAACYLYYDVLGHEKRGSAMPTPYLGPAFGENDIAASLAALEREIGSLLVHRRYADTELVERTAELLAGNAVVGWFQGRMEFGPRALGNRSILADPRRKENWQRVNLKIKFRESFRPFAPAVLAERADEYFSLRGRPSSHMLLVAPVKQRDIPAVTHVDGSARIQTVSREDNPLFHALLTAFEKRTGCPVLINTSFNVRGEPIVRTPLEALNCFRFTELDALVLGNALIQKSDNLTLGEYARAERERYLADFELD